MQTWFSPNCRWMNVHWIVPWRVDVFLEGAPDLKSMMTHHMAVFNKGSYNIFMLITWTIWREIWFEYSLDGLQQKKIFFCRQKIKETYLSLTLDYVENKQINGFFLNPNHAWKINGFGADDIEVDLLLS